MDVSKNISRKLSEASLQRYQDAAFCQNDYLVDFLHSDNFWVDVIAMGVSSNQESDFVPISPPKSFYDEKVDIVESRRTSPTKLSSVFSLDPPSISNHTKMTTSLPSFQSVSKSSTSSSLSEDFNQNSHNRDGDRSVYEAAVALNDVTLSDLADSVHNDHCV